MLASRIYVEQPTGTEIEPEDIFSSTLTLLYPDDTRNQHGDTGAVITYKSPRFGDIKLTIADPNGEQERQRFAHYLWNAGIHLSELISNPSSGSWNIKGERVLELGAGLGLSGIVSSLAGARDVVLSDYPSLALLKNLEENVALNVTESQRSSISVHGHAWGELNDDFSQSYKNVFTRILAADCFWMVESHGNLVSSMLHFLSEDPNACVLVVGGFHTGRAKLAQFFDLAEEHGLRVATIREVDVDGVTRPWAKERDGGKENPTELRRWLVEAVLKRSVVRS